MRSSEELMEIEKRKSLREFGYLSRLTKEIIQIEEENNRGPLTFRNEEIVKLRSGAIFLDRDGVINENNRSSGNRDLYYITSQEKFCFRPGVKEAIAKLSQNGWPVFVISNQEAVEMEKLSLFELVFITSKMIRGVRQSGGRIYSVYYCPHDPKKPCLCRKPLPRMLFKAAQDWNIYLTRSWMIGDNITDIIAGEKAGCQTIQIPLSYFVKEEKETKIDSIEPTCLAKDLTEAVEIILGERKIVKRGRQIPFLQKYER